MQPSTALTPYIQHTVLCNTNLTDNIVDFYSTVVKRETENEKIFFFSFFSSRRGTQRYGFDLDS